MFCNHCGNTIEDISLFCEHCGGKLEQPIASGANQLGVETKLEMVETTIMEVKMKHCRNCGKEGQVGSFACLGCGLPFGKGNLFCSDCGASTHPDAIICVKCGIGFTDFKYESSSLMPSKLDKETQSMASPISANTSSNKTVIINNNQQKSTGVAILLAFLFGPLGLLYASPIGGLILFLLGIPIGLITAGIGFVLVWISSIIWAIVATSNSSSKSNTFHVN